jgi:hypothetical protein
MDWQPIATAPFDRDLELVNDMRMLNDLVVPERDLKKEPQRRDGLVDGRHTDAARRQILRARPIVRLKSVVLWSRTAFHEFVSTRELTASRLHIY